VTPGKTAAARALGVPVIRYLPSLSQMERLAAAWARVRRWDKVYSGFTTAGVWYDGANGNPKSTGLLNWDDVREDLIRQEDTMTKCQADAGRKGE
jgi:hypothetical protein